VTPNLAANIPDLPGHHWANAISMATPIAHKGSLAGAQVVARTAVELFARPDLVASAWEYFREEQQRDHRYTPFIGPGDAPAIDKNRETMAQFRPLLEPFYFDETKYGTYLEQLGITYPTVRATPTQELGAQPAPR
jgi:aminobenzoyl-glutamate utilization protein B